MKFINISMPKFEIANRLEAILREIKYVEKHHHQGYYGSIKHQIENLISECRYEQDS